MQLSTSYEKPTARSMAIFFRTDTDSFNELLTLVQPNVAGQDTTMTDSFTATCCCKDNFEVLAASETFKYFFRVSNVAIGRIVPDTSMAV